MSAGDVQPAEPMGAAPANAQNKNLRYEIEWHYTPADFFGEPLSEHTLDCYLQIGGGRVLATVPAEVYERTPSLRQQLDHFLDARFKVKQFRTARAYVLDNGSLTEFHLDGTQTRRISVLISAKFSMSAEFKVIDGDGKTIFDSSAERAREQLRHKQKRSDLETLDNQMAADLERYYKKHSRPEETLLNSLLSSYLASCNDPDNELVYLYEIRDALKKRFGGEVPVRQALAISGKAWSQFGRLADNEPLSQGRHRGNFVGKLRLATEEEIVTARLFVKKLLHGFLHYLEQSGAPV
jgi:hypothetical protein